MISIVVEANVINFQSKRSRNPIRQGEGDHPYIGQLDSMLPVHNIPLICQVEGRQGYLRDGPVGSPTREERELVKVEPKDVPVCPRVDVEAIRPPITAVPKGELIKRGIKIHPRGCYCKSPRRKGII